MTKKIALRPATDDDQEFLYTVYSRTRLDEVAQFGWDEAQEQAFLRMQFTARGHAYKMQFPAADHSIILFGETPVGRLIVNRTDEYLSLTDIAILPQYQKKGIATKLIKQLQVEAGIDRPLVLRVDKTNIAAKALYDKLEFKVIGETEILYSMKWIPTRS